MLRFCMCSRKGDSETVPGRSRTLSFAASASIRGLPSRNLTPVFLISRLFCKLRTEFSSNANHVIALSAPCRACFHGGGIPIVPIPCTFARLAHDTTPFQLHLARTGHGSNKPPLLSNPKASENNV